MWDKATKSWSLKKDIGSMTCTLCSFSKFAIIAIAFMLPSFGKSLSLRSKSEVPLDPCLEFEKRCDKIANATLVTFTSEPSCPRYHPDIFGGRVCLGCFRDDYEIEHWEKFSNVEKAFALEDASGRVQAAKTTDHDEDRVKILETCMPVEDLKRQAMLWRALEEKESTNSEAYHPDIDDVPNVFDGTRSNQNTDDDSLYAGVSTFEPAVPIASTVSISSKTETNYKATGIPKAQASEELKINSGRLANETQNEALRNQQKVDQEDRTEQHQSPPPPTPCTRICRYNADCYDGKVCIGCFRDTHDIAQWSTMSPLEKTFSLEDAADRCKDLSNRGKDTDSCFEGGITEAALRDQATLWGTWKG